MRGLLRAAPGLKRIAAGYAAKAACSSLFVAQRPLASILAEDLQLVPELDLQVDADRGEVLARVRGFERRARLHPGLGARILHPEAPPQLPALPQRPGRADDALPWPRGEAVDAPTRPALEAVLDEAFAEPDPRRPRRTRGVVVVHRGRLVGERYAPGFGPETPQLGWSMTKSLVNALAGVLVGQGALDLHQPLPAPEWQAPGDPRRLLDFDVLLRMSSGLRFWEQYWNPLSHVATMLFDHPGAAAYAAGLPLVAAPDTRWSYASGSSNLLARALREVVGGEQADYLSFPARALFDRIGMQSAVMEVDASGHFVGSSFSYATPRDWARFGQLYLQDGIWEGERILPEGWVEATRTPTPAAPLGEYGSHFWLNAGAPGNPARRMYPRVPADAFFARGHDEQSVSIVPSRETVIVRLGQTADSSAWDLEDFLAQVLGALPAA
jgi:CubicO group peptidase (beta-lactamase class C family)